MAIRKVLLYSQHEDLLRKVCDPVHQIDPKLQRLIRDLKDTLAAHEDGIGLAAPQINRHKRVIIVCLGGDQEGIDPAPPVVLINPKILEESDLKKDFDGCLSFPGLYGETVRPHMLRISALDEDGNLIEARFDGFDAVAVHHEIDHLEGILFIDRIEKKEDLYQLVQDENGNLLRAPINNLIS